MHVSLCSYYTIRILISKTLTGTYEGGYTYVFEMCCYRTLDIITIIFGWCSLSTALHHQMAEVVLACIKPLRLYQVKMSRGIER